MPARRAGDNPWPLWPHVFRVSSAHEEGGDRHYAVATTGFTGGGDGQVRRLHGHKVTMAMANGRPSFAPEPGTTFDLSLIHI